MNFYRALMISEIYLSKLLNNPWPMAHDLSTSYSHWGCTGQAAWGRLVLGAGWGWRHQNQGKELTLDHHHSRAHPKSQSGVTCSLAGRRRQDHSCGRAWWLCNTSWVFCCFALGNTLVHPCKLCCIPTAISWDTDCMCRCSHENHCFSLLLVPITFVIRSQDSIPVFIYLAFTRLSSWVSITEGHGLHHQEFASKKSSVKFFWEKKWTLFWLDWCYYRVDPPK